MSSVVCLIANLLQLPPAIRLSIAAWRLLAGVLRIFTKWDFDTLAQLTPRELTRLDASLQLAEACIARVIWLQARKLAGLPPAPPPSPFRYAPPAHLAAPHAMAARALNLFDRLMHARTAARRLAQKLSRSDVRTDRAHPARTPFSSAPNVRRASTQPTAGQPAPIRSAVRATGPPWRARSSPDRPNFPKPRRPIVSGGAGARLLVERPQAQPIEAICGR